jgi:hypothetical protein
LDRSLGAIGKLARQIKERRGELVQINRAVAEAERVDNENLREKATLRHHLHDAANDVERNASENLADLLAQRRRLISDIRPFEQDRLQFYNRALSSYPDDPIAEVRSARCGGCNGVLREHHIAGANSANRVQICPTCKRILVPPASVAYASVTTAALQWEVLPTGWWREPAFLSGVGTGAGWREVCLDIERIRQLDGLNPIQTYVGLYMGKRQYIVFEFERVAFADCPLHGNALYYTRDPRWRDIFVHTKREALQLGAKRLIHRGDWLARAQRIVAGAD